MGNGQQQANARVWARGRLVRRYAGRTLSPVEAIVLARWRDALAGRVLELGCGAGRVTGYLVRLAREVSAVDLAPAMVAAAAARYPGARFTVADIADLASLPAGPFDAIVGAANVIDVFDDETRRRVLRQLATLAVPGGLLLMSSHNRAHAPYVPRPPHLVPTADPVALARRVAAVPLGWWNHRRLAPLERSEERYAIVNDEAHAFGLLHYYVTRDEQERQLAEEGWQLLECLDGDGDPVPAGAAAERSPSLWYVARVAG
jgi:SAM-dependent methyltransferase